MDARDIVVTRDIGGIREQVRATRRAVSLPLLITGAAITVVTIRDLVVSIIFDNTSPGEFVRTGLLGLWPVRLAFYLLVPVSFLVLWRVRRRLRSERGIGVTRPSGAAAGVVAVMLIFPPYFILTFLLRTMPSASPFLAFAVGLLVVGLAERTTAVWVWALAVGVPGTIEAFYGFTNRLPESLWFFAAHDLILLTLAVLTVGAGAVAWGRENRVLSVR